MDSVAEQIMADFPGWEVFPNAGHWYARWLKTSPPVILRAASLSALRVQIALRAGTR